MSMSIGIISIRHLDHPGDIAYDFAQYMAERGLFGAYMSGMGHSWIPFTHRQTERMLDDFVEERRLSRAQREKIAEWLKSLPWFGGYEAFTEEGDGPGIELYFNW